MRRVGLTLGAFVPCLALHLAAYGAWLVATPDYEGTRQKVGGFVLAVAVPVILLALAAFLRGLRHGPRARKG
jgi:hypothetical protein